VIWAAVRRRAAALAAAALQATITRQGHPPRVMPAVARPSTLPRMEAGTRCPRPLASLY
jgi:hypothetical protein